MTRDITTTVRHRLRRGAGVLAAVGALTALPLLAPVASAAPAALAPTAVTAAQAAQLNQVFALTNQYRQQNGCKALIRNSYAEKAAQGHADWMNTTGTFSHTGANVAYGQKDAQAVMTAWMNSPGHRANILNCKFTRIGVGLAGTRNYWVQDFGY
jgi:uncharacterized protein YkwD